MLWFYSANFVFASTATLALNWDISITMQTSLVSGQSLKGVRDIRTLSPCVLSREPMVKGCRKRTAVKASEGSREREAVSGSNTTSNPASTCTVFRHFTDHSIRAILSAQREAAALQNTEVGSFCSACCYDHWCKYLALCPIQGIYRAYLHVCQCWDTGNRRIAVSCHWCVIQTGFMTLVKSTILQHFSNASFRFSCCSSFVSSLRSLHFLFSRLLPFWFCCLLQRPSVSLLLNTLPKSGTKWCWLTHRADLLVRSVIYPKSYAQAA